jgi:hypothetical protein
LASRNGGIKDQKGQQHKKADLRHDGLQHFSLLFSISFLCFCVFNFLAKKMFFGER